MKTKLTVKEQEIMWNMTIMKMKEMLDENCESYIAGDINLNVKTFNTEYKELNTYNKSLYNMSNNFNDLVSEYNMIIYDNNTPTRNERLIDVIYTNNIKKIYNYSIVEDTEGSDHNIVKITRTLKENSDSQRYIYNRDYYNYNNNIVQHEIICDERHNKILETNDVNEAMNNLVNMLTDTLDRNAPMKKR